MKQDSLIFVTMIIVSGGLAVAIFIFFGQLILNFLKIPDKTVSKKSRILKAEAGR